MIHYKKLSKLFAVFFCWTYSYFEGCLSKSRRETVPAASTDRNDECLKSYVRLFTRLWITSRHQYFIRSLFICFHSIYHFMRCQPVKLSWRGRDAKVKDISIITFKIRLELMQNARWVALFSFIWMWKIRSWAIPLSIWLKSPELYITCHNEDLNFGHEYPIRDTFHMATV